MSVGSLLLAGLEVLAILGEQLGADDARGLQIDDLSCEVRRCDEVVRLVVQGEGTLVGEELMLSLHAAKGEDAGQLQLSD